MTKKDGTPKTPSLAAPLLRRILMDFRNTFDHEGEAGIHRIFQVGLSVAGCRSRQEGRKGPRRSPSAKKTWQVKPFGYRRCCHFKPILVGLGSALGMVQDWHQREIKQSAAWSNGDGETGNVAHE